MVRYAGANSTLLSMMLVQSFSEITLTFFPQALSNYLVITPFLLRAFAIRACDSTSYTHRVFPVLGVSRLDFCDKSDRFFVWPCSFLPKRIFEFKQLLDLITCYLVAPLPSFTSRWMRIEKEGTREIEFLGFSYGSLD